MLAAQYPRSAKMIKMLIQNGKPDEIAELGKILGCPVDRMNRAGQTALSIALDAELYENIDALLEGGATASPEQAEQIRQLRARRPLSYPGATVASIATAAYHYVSGK